MKPASVAAAWLSTAMITPAVCAAITPGWCHSRIGNRPPSQKTSGVRNTQSNQGGVSPTSACPKPRGRPLTRENVSHVIMLSNAGTHHRPRSTYQRGVGADIDIQLKRCRTARRLDGQTNGDFLPLHRQLHRNPSVGPSLDFNLPHQPASRPTVQPSPDLL